MVSEISLTDQVVSALRSLPKDPEGLEAPRPSTPTLRQVKKILLDFETSKLPYPTIIATRNGVVLVWSSYLRDVKLRVDRDGDMTCETTLKSYNRDGGPGAVLNSESPIEGLKGISQMIAWYLTDVSAEA